VEDDFSYEQALSSQEEEQQDPDTNLPGLAVTDRWYPLRSNHQKPVYYCNGAFDD